MVGEGVAEVEVNSKRDGMYFRHFDQESHLRDNAVSEQPCFFKFERRRPYKHRDDECLIILLFDVLLNIYVRPI